MMTTNLEYYKVFYYAAKCGSLTMAAGELNISQPAVSQSLKQLEESLKVKLFSRTPRGVKLTAEGEVLFSYVEKGYEQIELGEKRLFQMMKLERGCVYIGASDMTLRFFLLPYLEKFHEEYPGIQVSVTNGPTPATMELLRQGKIDFGVISGPFEAKEEEFLLPVREIEDIFVAGKTYQSYKGRTVSLKELEELPLITLDKETSTWRYVESFFEENGIHLQSEFELSTSDMIVQFSLRNLGIGNVVRDFAKDWLEREELFELQLEKKPQKRTFLVATDKRNTLSAAAKKLLSMIEDDISENTCTQRKSAEEGETDDKNGDF